MDIAWHCESDPFCRKVLAKHWPDVPCFEDICGLTGASVAPVDVLCGGFPCQDISLAGKGAGIDGARSGLWSEYARLIGELRPRYVCVENVSALLIRGMGRVLGDLAVLGYDAEWSVFTACAFGAPHARRRLWLVAYPYESDGQARLGNIKDGSWSLQGFDRPESTSTWLQAPSVPSGMDYGLSDQLDRNGALGNALVPQIAEWVGRRIIAYETSLVS